MNHVDATHDIEFERVEYRPWVEMLWRPVAIAAAAVTILLLIVVAASKSAWDLLGAGRGFVPEDLYLVSGFVLVLATTFGQVIGWAAGVGIAVYVMTLLGFPATWTTLRLAMTIVYIGLGVLPLLAYHVLYGRWLLGMPRAGLTEWLAANSPDAYWLITYGHPIVDFSLIPLAAVFLAIVWKYGERLQRDSAWQTALALALFGTSLSVALSLAIHSILVHVRIG
jgi:hypothetical protein